MFLCFYLAPSVFIYRVFSSSSSSIDIAPLHPAFNPQSRTSPFIKLAYPSTRSCWISKPLSNDQSKICQFLLAYKARGLNLCLILTAQQHWFGISTISLLAKFWPKNEIKKRKENEVILKGFHLQK